MTVNKPVPPSAGEVRALAHQLLTWADQLIAQHAATVPLTEPERHDLALAVAEAMREVNAVRSRIFDMPFGNPSWDVMLELFIREGRGLRVTLDELALEGELAALTVHRCVEVLGARGLLDRVPDRFDAHVEWIALSPSGRKGMIGLLLEAARFMRPRVESRISSIDRDEPWDAGQAA